MLADLAALRPTLRASRRAAGRLLAPPASALLAWLLSGADLGMAHANRFGPPWQARVNVDQTVLYSRPDPGSAPVGPLPAGAEVVVTGVGITGRDGADWTAITDGFLPSSAIAEDPNPWVAEVAVPSVSVYAKPTAGSAIRRPARQGDLLRVTGVSPGLAGDASIWWATTEGFVGLHSIKAASSS